MKILAINGSHRGKNGYTQFLINQVFNGARESGAVCDTIVLAEQNVKRCTGCFSCQREGRYYQCIHDGKDDTQDIFNRMREADLILFATPVYVFNISSLLLNLLDRYPSTSNCGALKISQKGLFFHPIDPQLCSKPFATIFCQDNLEYETHKNILSYFKTYSKFMDAPYVGSLVRRSGSMAAHGKDPEKLEKYPVLKKAYAAFEQAGHELALNGRISRSTVRKANKSIIHPPYIVKLMAKVPVFRTAIEQRGNEFVEL